MKKSALIVAFVLVVSGSAAAASDPPQVPPALQAPSGHEAYLRGYAEGTQNYVCIAGATGMRWQFLGPQATLFLTFQGTPWHQITTHFLSANPAEAGTPRATWQHSIDSSRVWARAIASSSDPAYVESGAIPWLLLEAVGSAVGPLRGRALASTTFIQRVNTSGGVAPTIGCSDTSHEGVVALVPYRTDYYFYRASR